MKRPDLEHGEILVVDNYDSFTHNAEDLLTQLGASVSVIRNDRLAVEDVRARGVCGIVLSPGPGRPLAAGISVPLIRALGSEIPILGICLGLQAIAVAYGGRVARASVPLHGIAAPVHHDGEGLLEGIPTPFPAARYHSLVVDPGFIGTGLRVTARSAEGEVMALAHEEHPVEGVQFHPESYLSPFGPRILAAFLRRAGLSPLPVRDVVR